MLVRSKVSFLLWKLWMFTGLGTGTQDHLLNCFSRIKMHKMLMRGWNSITNISDQNEYLLRNWKSFRLFETKFYCFWCKMNAFLSFIFENFFSSYHDMINTLRRTNHYHVWRKASLFGTLELVFLFLFNLEKIKSRRRIFCFSITFYWVAKVTAHQKVVIKLVEVPSYCSTCNKQTWVNQIHTWS